jgi:hypothetical protein
MVVVDDDDQGVRVAVVPDLFERLQDIDGVEDVVEEDVVERFAKFEFFGIALREEKLRELLSCDLDHRLAKLNADAITWFHRIEQMAGLAADL